MENFREGEEMEKRECKIRRQGREHWKQGQGVNRLKNTRDGNVLGQRRVFWSTSFSSHWYRSITKKIYKEVFHQDFFIG